MQGPCAVFSAAPREENTFHNAMITGIAPSLPRIASNSQEETDRMSDAGRWSWVVFAFGFIAIAQQPRELVQQAVQTEVAADVADHSRWLYYDVDQKPGDNVTQWVAQTPNGDLDRVLERNGAPVSRDEQR